MPNRVMATRTKVSGKVAAITIALVALFGAAYVGSSLLPITLDLGSLRNLAGLGNLGNLGNLTTSINTNPILAVEPLQIITTNTTTSAAATVYNNGLSSMTWSADPGNCSWITNGASLRSPKTTDSLRSSTLVLNLMANTSNAQRSCPITVTASTVGTQNNPQTITLTQTAESAITFTVSPATREVQAISGEGTVTINSIPTNIAWSVSSQDLLTNCAEGTGSWISLSALGGNTSSTVTVSYTPNPSQTNTRVCNIPFRLTGIQSGPIKNFTVTQESTPTITANNMTIGTATSSAILTFSTNSTRRQQWWAVERCDWMKLNLNNVYAGQSATQVRTTTDANNPLTFYYTGLPPEISSRTCQIEINLLYLPGSTKLVTIAQTR